MVHVLMEREIFTEIDREEILRREDCGKLKVGFGEGGSGKPRFPLNEKATASSCLPACLRRTQPQDTLIVDFRFQNCREMKLLSSIYRMWSQQRQRVPNSVMGWRWDREGVRSYWPGTRGLELLRVSEVGSVLPEPIQSSSLSMHK